MKTNRVPQLILVVFGFAVFSTVGCTQTKNATEVPSSPANNATKNTAITIAPAPTATVQVATTASPDVASARWSGIEDDTFDMRAQFLAGLNQMEAMVDDQASTLTAKRAAMKSTTDTKDWDFAMKEMEDARSYLKSMNEDLSKATPETWNQEKDKVRQAWARTQKAYENVKSSTTN
jgi:hypothetical protein